jgi:hypothetical protein
VVQNTARLDSVLPRRKRRLFTSLFERLVFGSLAFPQGFAERDKLLVVVLAPLADAGYGKVDEALKRAQWGAVRR